MDKCRQDRAPQAGNRGVLYARSGTVGQVVTSRRVCIVSDRVQCRTRQIKKQRVIGLVKENDRISPEVIDADFTGPQIRNRRLPTVLPIFTIGKVAEHETNEKSVFPLNRAGHSRRWIVTSNLGDGHVGFAQHPRNDCRCALYPHSFGKQFSVTFTGRHDRSPRASCWARYLYRDTAATARRTIAAMSQIEALFDKKPVKSYNSQASCPKSEAAATGRGGLSCCFSELFHC